ncbi:MAG: P-loop NTPase [Deltaproteobacteria bacterium]|nr:P-loop NTPase [Deltaproteobacteria bacterium]
MTERKSHIFAFGGGKGGIGKSFLSANIAASISKMGYRVALIDLDLGGANQHTFFGIDRPQKIIDDFIEHRVKKFSEILLNIPDYNIMLAAGIQNDLKATNFNIGQKARLFAAVKALDFDYIIIDIGAGMSISTLDTFNIAPNGVLITYPEPTALENCYKFLKSAFLRELRTRIKNKELKDFVDNIYDGKIIIPTGVKLFDYFNSIHTELANIAYTTARQHYYYLILNSASEHDLELLDHIPLAIKRFYGFNITPLGGILYDDKVRESIKKMRPYVELFPDSPTTLKIHEIASNIVNISKSLCYD